MEKSTQPLSMTFDELARARTCFGLGTAPWSERGELRVADDWWLALSLTGHVDYNLVLLHGPGATAAAPEVLDDVDSTGVPAMVMLAGEGLAAADVLGDAGWVCTGALPFMAKSHGPKCDDPGVRLLGADDLEGARCLAAAAFGVPEEVGAIVYDDAALTRPDTRIYGLFEEGELRCCSLTMWVEGEFSVGWALSTAPEHQRSGYGRRLIRASNHHRITSGGPTRALLTATRAGERLYRAEGYTTVEHWQTWSRPRWVLR
jgi:GNAT superfamily N-acetyltransferase